MRMILISNSTGVAGPLFLPVSNLAWPSQSCVSFGETSMTQNKKFGDLPLDAMFIHNYAVHQKYSATEGLNYHTMKYEDFPADFIVETVPE
jgi:hypothetical protein